MPRHKQVNSSSRGGNPDAPINKKHLLFLRHYTASFDRGKYGSITEAAVKAGYPAKSACEQGSWILGRPNVQKWLAEHDKKVQEKHDITLDKIVDELAKIGFSNIANYLQPDARGLPAFRKLEEIDQAHMAAISEITVDTRHEFEGRGDDREQTATVDKVKFKLSNKVESLVTLARVLGFMPGSDRRAGGEDDPHDGDRKVIIEVRTTAMPLPRRRSEET